MADTNPLVDLSVDTTTQIGLSWNNLQCSIKTKQGVKTILKSISGHANHSEFLVIMGSSGAGKTTLLNILSNRLQKSKKVDISGEILVNGSPVQSNFYSDYVGYVMQEDFLIESLTVYECLMFAAKMKTKYRDKNLHVLELMRALKLEKCKNSYIGGPLLKGISGGEKKRTSIAMELITDPSVLFLDEPTSGLDSYMSVTLCKLLLEKASQGKTIISTIHQPSSEIFHMFDRLMLMCDGQVVYHGRAKKSVSFFASAGFECPHLSNPADFFMEVLFISNSNELTEDEKQTVQTLVSAYKSLRFESNLVFLPLTENSHRYHASIAIQIIELVKRNCLRIMRNSIIGIHKINIMVVCAVMINIMYWNMGTRGHKAMMNRDGFLFYNLSCLMLCNIISSCLTFPVMLPVMIKEYQSNTYGIFPYFLAQTLTDIIFDSIVTVVYTSTFYWSINLNTSSEHVVFEFFAISYLIFFAGGSLGMMCGSSTSKPDMALAGTSVLLFPFLYFSGFYRSGTLPEGFKWMKYLSIYYYAFEAYMKNQYDGLTIHHCQATSADAKSEYVNCDPIGMFDVKLSVNKSVGILVGFCALFRLLSFLLMLKSAKQASRGG